MNTEEGNKLIALFSKNDAINSPHLTPASDLKYHTSWNWLMPVCKKFDTLYVRPESSSWLGYYENLCDKLDGAVTLYEITPVWETIIECMIWYFKQDKIYSK